MMLNTTEKRAELESLDAEEMELQSGESVEVAGGSNQGWGKWETNIPKSSLTTEQTRQTTLVQEI